MSIADNISFSNFCHLCTRLKNGPKEKRFDILQHYVDNWKTKSRELKEKQSDVDDSFFPVLRLLLPHLDRERGAYGVKEHTLGRIYVRILSLPKEGREAGKLLDYRAPKVSGYEAADFADVAYWILKNRCAEGGELSIEEINKHLDKIAAYNASNEPRRVESELVSLLTTTSAEEQKWLIRILLKDMKLGIAQNSIFRAYHPDAKELYDSNNNLRKVSDLLKNSEIRLNEIEIELFLPFKPMLSEECDIQKIEFYLKKSSYFYVETKLDGERFQLHMKEGNYKYFSRNGYDYTSNFGGTLHEGTLTPRIAKRFRLDVTSCILDGEMISWNHKTQTFATKAKNIDVKNLKDFQFYQPCFCVFDVLLHNNKILTNMPLNMRLTILEKIIDPLEGAIIFLNRKRISSKTEAIDSLNEAIDNREEGIVIKEFMSMYKPNIRKNGGWYKIKPEYTDGLSDTLDLLIIGGYFGSGRLMGKISHFLLGVAVSVSQDNKLFYSTARVGSGYSMNELSELLSKLESNWNETKIGEMPPSIEWAKEKPDVWIEPEKSFILEIKAAEIILSNLFKTGHTLRFPRVEKIRYDKSWKNCLTIEELLDKKKIASGKLATSSFIPSEGLSPQPKKKRSSFSLYSPNKGINASEVVRVSELLSGKEVCIFGGYAEVDKLEIEKKIIEFGGTLVKNPGKNTFCILAEKDSTARIKNIIKSGMYDVIYPSWFLSQLYVENKEIPKLKPENFLAMSTRTKQLFAKSYDEFGDHYTLPSTKDTIKYPMMMAKKKCEGIELTLDDKYDMDVELYSGPNLYGIFRSCVAYFDRYTVLSDALSGISSDLDIFRIDFLFRGGQCLDSISNEVTHVIIFSKNLSRLEEINGVNRNRVIKFHVVTEKWIQLSINNGALSSEPGF